MKNKNELTTQMQRVVENIREPIDAMTIRDQFAMAAMQGVLSSPQDPRSMEVLARFSYEMSDAMLKERNK